MLLLVITVGNFLNSCNAFLLYKNDKTFAITNQVYKDINHSVIHSKKKESLEEDLPFLKQIRSNSNRDFLKKERIPIKDLFYDPNENKHSKNNSMKSRKIVSPFCEDSSNKIFYQSTQSLSSKNSYKEKHDDEELPFSAEQSNRLEVPSNKIQVRRNKASFIDNPTPTCRLHKKNKQIYKNKKKMIRRGMEMIVGGEPVNADPPFRFIELNFLEDATDCFETISINSRDFGPLLHRYSIPLVSNISRGLYCEFLTDKLITWNICPRDLSTLVYSSAKKYYQEKHDQNNESSPFPSSLSYKELLQILDEHMFLKENTTELPQNNIMTPHKTDELFLDTNLLNSTSFTNLKIQKKSYSKRKQKKKRDYLILLGGGELNFSLFVPKSILVSTLTTSKPSCSALKRVLLEGISSAINAQIHGFCLKIDKLRLNQIQETSSFKEVTKVSVKFHLYPIKSETLKQQKQTQYKSSLKKKLNMINMALSSAVDQGDMALALAVATRKQLEWSQSVRDRIVEEFLFDVEKVHEVLLDGVDFENGGLQEEGNNEDLQEDDVDEEDDNDDEEDEIIEEETLSLEGDKASLFLQDEVFFNVQEYNAPNSPYKGFLGPLLVDSVISKATQRQPRIIAIGDVHGCLDELQALLKKCDYRPGDLVVFLGDLVSKGPDSISVVQMAREIGAIGVRGNHDFEVIRWHQAIKSGADAPIIGSEHFQIASGLGALDLKWLHSLPWYISSRELNALFVHAGFVSGIRLGKQNPRLMMNMRSILPDGTVTSKFFSNWPWSRLWDGPQTVLFGHDADRGLQQYEHAIGLDTGCVYGGRLTACILPEKRLVSVSAKREYFQYRRKRFD